MEYWVEWTSELSLIKKRFIYKKNPLVLGLERKEFIRF